MRYGLIPKISANDGDEPVDASSFNLGRLFAIRVGAEYQILRCVELADLKKAVRRMTAALTRRPASSVPRMDLLAFVRVMQQALEGISYTIAKMGALSRGIATTSQRSRILRTYGFSDFV